MSRPGKQNRATTRTPLAARTPANGDVLVADRVGSVFSARPSGQSTLFDAHDDTSLRPGVAQHIAPLGGQLRIA